MKRSSIIEPVNDIYEIDDLTEDDIQMIEAEDGVYEDTEGDISHLIAMLDASEDQEAETISFMPDIQAEGNDELDAEFREVLESGTDGDEREISLEDAIDMAPPPKGSLKRVFARFSPQIR